MPTATTTQEIPLAAIESMLARVYPELFGRREADQRATREERLEDFRQAGDIRSDSLAATAELPAVAPLTMPCPTCGGAGETCEVDDRAYRRQAQPALDPPYAYSGNPTRCRPCGGSGCVPATCWECGQPATTQIADGRFAEDFICAAHNEEVSQ